MNPYPAIQFRIARPTNQLKEVVQFYHEGLQLPILGSFEDHNGYNGVMLGLPDSGHHLEFTSHENNSPCPAPTNDNLLVLYFNSEEKFRIIKDSVERLGHQAVAPENPYWKSRGLTYEDPDGWRVVLCQGAFPQH